MKEYFACLLLMATVCCSKSEDQINILVQQKCKEYNDKYQTVDKSDLQGEETWFPLPPPGYVPVINGDNAYPGANPHMVALGYTIDGKIKWVCGGSLISEQYVLTAAHCLKKRINSNNKEVDTVRLGVTKISATYESYPKDYKIIKTIAHPSYDPPLKYNDIGIVQLERPIEITKYIKPICLYTEDTITEKFFTLSALGWGFTKPTGSPSEILQRVELDLYSEEECNNAYAESSSKILEKGILQDKQICLGSYKLRPRDTCQGDSGGPVKIFFQESNNPGPFLFGVTSFGKSCGLLKAPGIYTRVSYYVPWIAGIVWPN